MNQHEHWLAVALDAAQEAGTYLQGEWRKTHTVRSKGFRDIVTDADIVVEKIILDRLHAAFPDHGITSEEGGSATATQTTEWLIDPIDGTTNFSRNNPNFCTVIAALENKEVVVGVILAPIYNHVFSAVRGNGATLNGTPIHVSEVKRLSHMIFGLDSPRSPNVREKMMRRLGILLTHGRTMRALGSAALNMAYVAAGWTDFYLHANLQPWDQAAAALMIEEAGGAMGTLSGADWTPFSHDPLAAASKSLIKEFHELMDKKLPEFTPGH